jgi:hypothetical protein
MSASLVKNSRFLSLQAGDNNSLLVKKNIESFEKRLTHGSHRSFIAVILKSGVVIRVDDNAPNRIALTLLLQERAKND